MVSDILLGFDFGTKSIGVAVGQKLTCTARALTTLKAKNGKPHWHQIAKLLKDWQPNYTVVGLPLNMDGTEQPLSKQVYTFANDLFTRFGITVKLQDERLSTIEARALLFKKGGYRALRKSKIDSQSAVIILQDWFEMNKFYINTSLIF
ncbi:Holliday junction resolvase RuvX [Candidatus Pantoea carbekii]|uniref:Putative pre-16S rRNA nuclease n=1 Tax=Candidatus Pantoea carbekii TaxID=1235990 RepID=U3U972_9GAMM|nr:Holliday junction resolvase RuvX [Candidatus Pantoea carbekii]AKC32557.1 putative Holliday junction resolvase YqgF [Candidatus Pantoea carbekii]BAO00288.1 YqgF protein [Candidatus Pantoea carbekii]